MTQTQDLSEHDMPARPDYIWNEWAFQFNQSEDVSTPSPSSEVEQADAAIRDALMHVYNG